MSNAATITITLFEKDILNNWSQSTLNDNHWGGGALTTPMDEIALHDLKHIKPDQAVSLHDISVNTFLIWAENNFGLPEETQLITKLSNYLKTM